MENQKVYDELEARFRAHFGRAPERVAYAPGRIEVLGNHTDYNEGLVFSAAISYGTFFAAARAEGAVCRLVAGDLMKEVSFPAAPVSRAGTDNWQNYVRGTFAGLTEGRPAGRGFDGMFLGNIPLGKGLSSSAALEMSAGLALGALYGIEKDAVSLARIGQRAEHEFAGCKCGLLDQISSLAGKAGRLVKTDFRTVAYETVPLGPDACFLLCDSNARHTLADGAYDERRAACEAAARHFAKRLRHPVAALRDVSMAEWALYKAGLDETAAARAAHPIGEDERVLLGAGMLEAGDLAGFGRLMFDSHESSRTLFENSCPELDFIVETAKKVPGIYGARLSGGGFGGSVVALTDPRCAETAAAAIENACRANGAPCGVTRVEPCDGARIVK